MTRAPLLAALLVALAARTPAQDIQGPTLTPRSFHVARPDDEKKGFGDRNDGTRVAARVEIPGRKIIAVDASKSKLDRFTDDKNTDLLAAAAPRTARPITAEIPTLGRVGDVAFHAPGCPAKGATKVRIKGSVVVLVGKDEKEVEKKDVSLKTGADLGFGTVKAPAAKFGRPDAGRPGSLVYEGSRPIISLTLLDGDGKEVACRINPFSSGRPAAVPGAPERPQHRTLITVTGDATKVVAVKVKYFDAVEEVTVPVDLEVGPGL